MTDTIFKLRTTRWLLATMAMLPIAMSAAPPKRAAATSSVARDPYLGVIVVDAGSGKVLREDNADARGHPASVLKLMVLLIVLEKIEKGGMQLGDTVPVGANASGLGGATVGLQKGEAFPLDEMLYAIMIHSANDAAVAIAEKTAGSVPAFVALMNTRAKELGMTGTEVHSVNGLSPAPGKPHDITTPRDISALCREVLKHPEALRYTSAREHAFRPDGGDRRIVMRSHNDLLTTVAGCDGLKTGFTSAAGYCIAATAKRHDQRVIVVVLGCLKESVRNATVAGLIEEGFALLR